MAVSATSSSTSLNSDCVAFTLVTCGKGRVEVARAKATQSPLNGRMAGSGGVTNQTTDSCSAQPPAANSRTEKVLLSLFLRMPVCRNRTKRSWSVSKVLSRSRAVRATFGL